MNLSTIRHESYLAAKAEGFKDADLNQAWRDANRDYVASRDASGIAADPPPAQ